MEEAGTLERVTLQIHGIVQGIGFRPFIHKLVRDFDLKGYIKNTSSGVELELDGEHETLERFLREIPEKAPKLAVIDRIDASFHEPPGNYLGFEIRQSKTEQFRNTLISPDICICEDCLRELNTPGNRRYRYPFINCTNCGPRFTIIQDVPYDRIRTSMGNFPMCPECSVEYADIENRRYHAQPDCCRVCGPEVSFSVGADDPNAVTGEEAIRKAREFLLSDRIVAVKGLGGVHLACRCDNPELIRNLRRRKHRDEKPFAVMCRDVKCAKEYCEVSADEEKILTGFRRPIVLLKKKPDPGSLMQKEALCELSENGYLGVMLPYTPVHVLLLGDDIDMLVMTSANLSDTPVIYRNEETYEKLQGIADGFLLNNRDIVTRCDDSLCYVLDGREYFLRRSRGYVPFPLQCGEHFPILACGAEQKASFALSKENYVFPCQHIGDLKNMETYEHYVQQISHFERLFDAQPQAAACDLHPDYLSTQFAEKLCIEKNLPLIRVQHHHAHMASCMADNRLDGEVIGLIWDGTGLGTDGTVWGGECLIGGFDTFRRFGSIRQIPLIGGDRAIKEIDRIACAFLTEAGESYNGRNAEKYRLLLKENLNCPMSSGMGRLFDGVAAILGVRETVGYEGQAAVLLENAAGKDGKEDHYPVSFDYCKSGGEEKPIMVFDWRPMISEIVSEKKRGISVSVIAAKFLNTLIYMALEQCIAARETTGLDRVVLSGGTFQNMILMELLPKKLRKAGFRVYIHKNVSCNDEGLCLGQLAVADYRLKEERNNVSGGTSAN